ncbi:RHS repeat-associated core domain-containing protein [Streptomyces sp. NPDC051993]|uniref:RHS repeat-associated core domain-containing protein n=1 Tax=Streptomyces sp. NPDC051993 TaxID=3155286 RepID=UPI003445C425
MYAYDAAGRLVGLTDPAGETARYRYDPAGNRLGIDRFPSSQLSVLSLVPVRAAAGARVTLSGTGFSTAAASNAVSFGGTAATVVSATATRLVVTVPAGAKAGAVSVTVAGASAQSVEAFALATPAPVVSSFAPTSAVAGAQVVISGSGFAATATDNVVRFNGRVARVVSASATSLTVEVPPGAADGLIEVATRDGRGASAGNFSVVGSGGPVYDSVVTTTVSDANPPSVAVTTPGHLGEVLFDAEQGDDVSFGFTASTFNTGLTLKLLDPRGTQVDSRSVSSSGGDWDVRNLPLAGRYSVIVDPGSNNIGAATVTLSNPAGGPLSLTGPSVAAQVNRPGQNGRWTLSAQAGQSLSVGFAVSAISAGKSVDARLYGPDGAEVTGSYRLLSPNSTDSLDIDALPQSGTYTVVANPVDGATGTVTATGSLYADAGTLDPAGAAVDLKIDRAGQNGWARFTGSVGQRLSLGVTSTGFTSYVPVEVRDPAGNRIDSFTVQTGSTTQWDGPQLTTSGTYTLAVSPNYAGTGSLSLVLSAPLTVGPLTTTAAATAVQIARTGQDAEATFSAQAGDNLSLGITSNTFPQSLSVSVIAPSGKKVVDRAYIGSGNTDSFGLPGVPESGTYTVVVDPYQGATGALNLTLSADATAAPVLDGAQAAATVARPGQRLRVEFTAPAGGAVGFGVTDNSLSQMAELRLVDASGGTGTYVDWVGSGSPDASYLAGLTAGAKYSLVLTPSSAGTGGLTAWLSSPVQAGQLTTAAPAQQGQVTRPGQQLDYTLPITAGEGDVVTFDGNTLTQASNLVLIGPDGGALGPTGFLNGAGTGKLSLRAPLAAGTYHVLVRPQRPTSGNVTATRLADVDGGTLTAGGGKKPAAITTAGQNAHYTFTGSAGQQLTLGLDAPATNWNLSVYGPNGQWLIDTRYMSTSDTSLALPALPVAGTYTLTVDPGSLATGTFNLGLTAAAGLAAKAPAAQKATTAVQSAKPTADKATTATAGVVPSGADAWQPSQQNLAGRDWLTGKGAAPKTPPALRGPPSQTALSGQVLKLDGSPLSRVAVRIGTKSGHTDEQGRFLLAGISTQDTTLVVDGTTANTKDRSYGRFDIHIQPKAGQTSELGFPVWMTPLDTQHTVHFDAPAKSEVVLKTPQIPGLEVRIPKGSVVRDEKGKPVTELGITPIALDRAPFPLPAHSVVPVFFTVQPGGTYIFPQGAQVIYPNYTHEPPGTRVEFMDYDPKAKGWYVYGHGQVSRDGRQVVPDATTRVWAFHGAMFNVSDLVPWDLSWIKDAFNWLSGDPVDLGTGMLTDSRTDLAVTDPLGSAEVARTYWQGDTHQRAFGIGRDLSYNVLLHSEKQYQEVDLYLPGGAKVHFTRTSPGTSYIDAVFEPTDTPSEFKGSKIVNADGQWELRFRDGTVWVFPEYALLKQIRDRHGNTLDITRLNGTKGEVTQVTTSGGRWITFGYDAQHRVTSARDNTGCTVSYTYDTAGRLSTVTDPAGKVSSYTYDGASNRIATATDARGIVYMSNTFDAAGRVKVQTLTEGATYSFAYTQTGTGQITATEVTQPGGAIRRVEFDTNGYGITDTAAYNTVFARKTTYTRGTSHRVDSVTDPYGRRTDLTYDANGYVTQSTEQAGTANARTSGTAVFDGPYDQPSKVTDPLGNTTLLGYFDNGDLKTVTDPEGRQTAYTYQPDGQVKTVTDAAGAATNYTYRLGELQSVTDTEGRTSTQFLDAAGRPSALTDTAGSATTMVYDVLNQTRQVTDPLGNTTGFGYDDNGNLTTLTDARNNTTTWGYDNADRPKTATDPLGAQASFEYDAAGLLHKATSRSGQVAISDHDLLGRTTQVRYGVNVLGQAESSATYDYAGTGNLDLLQKITDSQAGTQSFAYDAYDRTKTVTGPTGTVGYDYDGADRRTTMTAGGITTTYGYDKSSILTSLTAGTQQVTFGLDAVGREHTATLPGGFTRTTDTDHTGTVKAITYAQGTKTIGDLAYTRDERGLQSGLTGTLANTALPAAETGAAFGKDNRITTFNGRSFTYDADGQLKDDGQRTYTWNARGQLTGLGKAGVNSTFGYDPLGTRTAKTTGGTTGKFLTDGSNPAVEQDGSGATTATVTTSGLDQYLTRTENGATQIYLTDALGTVLGLANPDGTVATKYTYDPGGQPTTTGATSTNPYTFTGRENDGTGLLYYRDRYYDPQTGRFISQDPSGQAGGTNLYQYALSSPTTYSDPTGNNPMLAACAVNGLLDGGLDWLTQRLSGRKVSWGQVGNAALTGCMMGMAGEVFGMFLEARGGLRAASCMVNSFTADTPVLMADGTHKPIKDIHIGDKVAATDPETGETGPRTVTTLIQGTGDKQLIDITTTNSAGKPGHLTATDGHPFWAPDLKKWVPAGELKAGQWLQTSTGTWTQVSAVQHRSQTTTVYNLTVDELHTYYVLAGGVPVLVHNASCKTVAENDAGRFGDLNPGQVGDGLEAHHMPQNGLGFLATNEGGAIVMKQADHALTRTYKFLGRATKAAESGLPFRTVLARDIWDLRRIGQQQYGDPGYFNSGIQGLLAYYRRTGML